MSTSICGVRDLDGEFAKMVEVKSACENAKLPYPKELNDYFKRVTKQGSGSFSYGAGEAADLLRESAEEVDIKESVKGCGGVGTDGWEVDLSKLPADVKAIRFKNSY